jgi:hypothetical protein
MQLPANNANGRESQNIFQEEAEGTEKAKETELSVISVTSCKNYSFRGFGVFIQAD